MEGMNVGIKTWKTGLAQWHSWKPQPGDDITSLLCCEQANHTQCVLPMDQQHREAGGLIFSRAFKLCLNTKPLMGSLSFSKWLFLLFLFTSKLSIYNWYLMHWSNKAMEINHRPDLQLLRFHSDLMSWGRQKWETGSHGPHWSHTFEQFFQNPNTG